MLNRALPLGLLLLTTLMPPASLFGCGGGGGPSGVSDGGGSGGVNGSGGAMGSGGVNGSGGAMGSGGAKGSGGTNGSGGQLAVDGGADAGDVGGGGPAFATIQPIFAATCVRCHDPAHPFVPESPTFVALPLTPAGAYAALVSQPAHETCGGVLVTPGDPARSYLFHKLTDLTPCDGKRMPHPGMLATNNPLPQAQIDAIVAWIQGGAKP